MPVRPKTPSTNSSAPLGALGRIVCGLRRDRYGRYLIAVLKGFIDDSGSGGDSPWVVLAGYVASAEAWLGFDDEWINVLEDAPPIDCFHAAEAESLRPESQWAGVSKADRDEKIDRLIDVIRRFDLQPISVRMRQSDYAREVQRNIPPYWDDPYIILLNSLMVQLLVLVPDRFPGAGPVELVFDNHQKFRKRGPAFCASMAQHLPIQHAVATNIHYENDEDFPGLQAADLLAWQIRRAFSVTAEPRRRHYDAARTGQKGHPLFEFILSRDHLVKFMRKWDEQVARVATLFGFPADTRPWKK
jgi:Protein of unknown function (DUF3800)